MENDSYDYSECICVGHLYQKEYMYKEHCGFRTLAWRYIGQDNHAYQHLNILENRLHMPEVNEESCQSNQNI